MILVLYLVGLCFTLAWMYVNLPNKDGTATNDEWMGVILGAIFWPFYWLVCFFIWLIDTQTKGKQ